MQQILDQAISTLNRGGVIAYPTEAVFGLGCLADNRLATERICILKQRPIDQGVIVLIHDLGQLGDWIKPLDEHQRARLASTWPGPVTWLMPASDDCPSWLKGQHSTLAVRHSAHPLCRDLCAALDGPLVSTSANRSGQSPARSAAEVQAYFSDAIDLVIDADLGDADKPSEIRDLQSGQRLR